MKSLATQHQVRTEKPLASRQVQQQHLDDIVHKHTRRGWKLILRTENQAQIVTGHPTRHLLHLVLSLLTAGLWIPIWILCALFGGEKSRLLTVDQYGTVRA